MDTLTPKTHITARGLTYAYHNATAAPGKPTLLFLHGFPSSSWDWSSQVAHFAPKGFGLIVPDMLGYGGTDKPTDAALYVGTALARDMVELLDAENVSQVVVVAHDWGSQVASRVLNLFPARVAAVAFLSVAYSAPNPSFDYLGSSVLIRERFGRDFLGYWEFFSEDGADKVIEEHMDSFLSLLFPNPPELWVEHICAFGGARTWVSSHRLSPPPSYATPDVIAHFKDSLLHGGMAAPLKWYTVNTVGHNSKDDALISEAAYNFSQPVFFAGTEKCAISLPAIGLAGLKEHAKGPVTYREFDSDHWIMLSHSERLNKELDKWIVELSA